MPTDIPAFRAKLLQERTIVAEQIALLDVPDELARFQAAEATLRAAQTTFENKSRRWTLVSERVERLRVLDDQIELLT